jgi:pre-rRNA-processing protein TSR4
LANSNDDWGTGRDGADWSVAPDSTGALDSEIESLLQVRASIAANSSRQEPQREPSNPAACPETWLGVAEPSVPEALPCRALEIYEEPEAVAECAGQHERELYERYLKEECELGGVSEDLMKLSPEQQAELRKEEEGMKAEMDANADKFDSDSDIDDDDEVARTDAQWFQRFQRRLERSPNQVIRYSWGGKVLWIAAPPAELLPGAQGPPRCERCGAQRIFELQILPTLVYQVLRGDCNEPAWGTVAVFTCAEDCESHDPCEEFVIVQPAE